MKSVYDMCRQNQAKALRFFEGHQIADFKVTAEGEAYVELLDRKPQAFGHFVRVQALKWGHLLVYGDWEPVMFGGCAYKDWRSKIQWIGNSSFDYAHEKARIGSGQDFIEDDFDCAKIQLLDLRRHESIDAEVAREVWDHLVSEDMAAAQGELYSADCDLRHFGSVPSWEVYIAWAAARKAHNLLLEKEEQEAIVGIDWNLLWDRCAERSIGQHRAEWTSFLQLLKPGSRILQIGGRDGAEAFGLAHKASELVTVDNARAKFDTIDLKRRCSYWYVETNPLQCPTNDLNGVNGTFDVIYVDWDHSYESVRGIYEKFWPLVRSGGIMAFHDIVDSEDMRKAFCEVHKLWMELCACDTYDWRQIGGYHPWGGIGVLRKR